METDSASILHADRWEPARDETEPERGGRDASTLFGRPVRRVLHGRDEADTRALGLEIATLCRPGTVIGLTGELGSGKTALTRYIAEGLGIEGPVTSPTFTILQVYRGGRLPLFHFDAYRLQGEDAFADIGAEEFLYGGGVSVVEWADRVAGLLPPDTLFMQIGYEGEEGRWYRCTF